MVIDLIILSPGRKQHGRHGHDPVSCWSLDASKLGSGEERRVMGESVVWIGDLGFEVWGLWNRDWGRGLREWLGLVASKRILLSESSLKFWNLEIRVWGLGFRVESFGCRVWVFRSDVISSIQILSFLGSSGEFED